MGRKNRKNRVQSARQEIATASKNALTVNDVANCDLLPCPNCGHTEFNRNARLKFVSRLMTGQAKDSVAIEPVDRCAECGQRVNLHEAMKKFKEQREQPPEPPRIATDGVGLRRTPSGIITLG
jgi:predicted RNA-binding Zn-ribbon protein involved in translation (DUF1610 family)